MQQEIREATEITNINDLSFDVKKGHKYISLSRYMSHEDIISDLNIEEFFKLDK